jgi:hypothetical protein
MSTQYEVGSIVDSSWGYDQTNVDFYRIEKRTGSTVWLIPLTCRRVDGAGLTGTATPGDPKAVGEYEIGSKGYRWNGKPIRRTLKYRNGQPVGFSIKHGWASAWNGAPVNWTAYA